jgi:hypothetical protein
MRAWRLENPRGPWEKVWRNKIKLEMVLQAGGRCVDCGFDDLSKLVGFDFDHRDGRDVDIRHRTMVSLTRERRAEELSKCDLVCAICHRVRTRDRLLQRYAKED